MRGAVLFLVFLSAGALLAQEDEEEPSAQSKPAAPKTAREQAPIDLTGYWISVVTQDWRWRMVTPKKGDYPGIPLNAEGKKIANAWDPAKDEASGEQCKAYAAPAIMRLPVRLHVTWQDDSTLRMDIDAGTQTRLFHFRGSKAESGAPTWQGDSEAQWELVRTRIPPHAPGPVHGGNLKVLTAHLRPGYLRKNGVPYGAGARMTEYLDVFSEPSGGQSLLITTIIEDPQYLNQPILLNTNFKKLADATGWNPTPCSAR
ncbi:MAG TPA: hypothetical protein VMB25_12710 [Bryobacteraceae bacterium]|nr:hypothetical protein [Bryobacteraceae bacterium]